MTEHALPDGQDVPPPGGVQDVRPAGAPGSLAPAPGEPTPPIIPAGLDATLAFVRHGESTWVAQGRFQGQGDPPLSRLGRRQATLVARRLARRALPPALPLPAASPLAIVHSPLARASETAERVERALARAARTARGPRRDAAAAISRRAEPGLMEIGQGEWEGVPGAQIAERWGDVLERWRRTPVLAWAPGGESLAQVDVRVRGALRTMLAELAAADPDEASASRSHVLGYTDAGLDDPWTVVVGHDGVFKIALLALLDMPLDRFWTIPFALCGVTVVEVRDGRPRLRLHNATDHLAELEDAALRARERERPRSGAL